jgi:Tetratricopeptide repeat.
MRITSATCRYDEALARIKQGEKAGEDFGEFWRCKGSILENLGRYEEALEAYRRSRKFHNKDWTIFQMANCYEKLKRYSEAIAELDGLLKLNPADRYPLAIRSLLIVRRS